MQSGEEENINREREGETQRDPPRISYLYPVVVIYMYGMTNQIFFLLQQLFVHLELSFEIKSLLKRQSRVLIFLVGISVIVLKRKKIIAGHIFLQSPFCWPEYKPLYDSSFQM